MMSSGPVTCGFAQSGKVEPNRLLAATQQAQKAIFFVATIRFVTSGCQRWGKFLSDPIFPQFSPRLNGSGLGRREEVFQQPIGAIASLVPGDRIDPYECLVHRRLA